VPSLAVPTTQPIELNIKGQNLNTRQATLKKDVPSNFSKEIYEKGTLKATEHDKYENIAGSV
jgi:hypothetical protein